MKLGKGAQRIRFVLYLLASAILGALSDEHAKEVVSSVLN